MVTRVVALVGLLTHEIQLLVLDGMKPLNGQKLPVSIFLRERNIESGRLTSDAADVLHFQSGIRAKMNLGAAPFVGDSHPKISQPQIVADIDHFHRGGNLCP